MRFTDLYLFVYFVACDCVFFCTLLCISFEFLPSGHTPIYRFRNIETFPNIFFHIHVFSVRGLNLQNAETA